MTLMTQLRAAEEATIRPRARVDSLNSALREAIAAEEFGQAESIKSELESARTELIIVEAAVRALRDGAAAVAQDRAAIEREIQMATQRAQAGRDLAVASAAEQRGMGDLDSAIERMFDHLRAAQRELRAALAHEHSVGQARQVQWTAREHAGQVPPGTAPRAASPNKASVLAEQDTLVSQLARWSQ
jgi:hypothetical protein